MANAVSDAPGFEFRIGGAGPEVDRLEWDVKLYFALNGAVHDAAVAAWGAKGYYDTVATDLDDPLHGRARASRATPTVRPTTPTGSRSCPAWSRSSRQATTAPGERHEALAGHEGEIAIRAWAGNPADPETADGRGRPGSWRSTGSRTSSPRS